MHLIAILFVCFIHLVNAMPIEKIMVDMTYVLDENVQNYPLWKKYEMKVVINGSQDNFDWLQGEEITTATHMGTHMDAPSHFVKGGLNIDDIPVSKFIAPAAVINIVARAEEDSRATVTIEDLQQWEATTGQSLNGTIVLVNSGWGKKWNDRAAYLGTTNEDDLSTLSFPGISGEASQWLVDNRDVIGVGLDTLSIDVGGLDSYPSHNILLSKGLYALENVANVDKIPIYGAKLHVMPMKLGRASGAPTRIVATFPKIIFAGSD